MQKQIKYQLCAPVIEDKLVYSDTHKYHTYSKVGRYEDLDPRYLIWD